MVQSERARSEGCAWARDNNMWYLATSIIPYLLSMHTHHTVSYSARNICNEIGTKPYIVCTHNIARLAYLSPLEQGEECYVITIYLKEL